jgi:SAM-dependent methyltransferase
MSIKEPCSEACERNKEPILSVLRDAFRNVRTVLEVGSGTGQHAVHFARNLPHLVWQPTELLENLPGIKLWLEEAGLPNIKEPIALDVSEYPWQTGEYEAVFTANTMHIMPEALVELFFFGLDTGLIDGGTVCIYGPFNYGGKYTSESNERFDEFLHSRDPESGIRDFEWVNSLAEARGLKLSHDHEMPANNRLLEWRRVP